MANFDFDQAEGLRRMLAGPKPRIDTFLCATPDDDKGAMLVNLAASMARAGNDVLVVDAKRPEGNSFRGLYQGHGLGLLDREESGPANHARPETGEAVQAHPYR